MDAAAKAGGPDGQEARDRYWRQIERLLAFPGVGALNAGAIASNLGAPAGSLDAMLAALVATGRLVHTGDGRFVLPSPGRRE